MINARTLLTAKYLKAVASFVCLQTKALFKSADSHHRYCCCCYYYRWILNKLPVVISRGERSRLEAAILFCFSYFSGWATIFVNDFACSNRCLPHCVCLFRCIRSGKVVSTFVSWQFVVQVYTTEPAFKGTWVHDLNVFHGTNMGGPWKQF